MNIGSSHRSKDSLGKLGMSVMQVTVDHRHFTLKPCDITRNLSSLLPTIAILARTSHGNVPHITERT